MQISVITALLAVVISFTTHAQAIKTKLFPQVSLETNFEGAVYAMTNKVEGNSIVAYGRNDDGTLDLIGEFQTWGLGGVFDGGEGLDPLVSANSVTLTDNRRFLITVNAGSRSISVFKIRADYSLRLTSKAIVPGVGPNSVAYRDGIVYVTSIDADGNFDGEPDQERALGGFFLSPFGRLSRIRGSTRLLTNRSSDVRFSPDGKLLVVSSINAGSSALPNDDNNEIVVYGVKHDGSLTSDPVSIASSTEQGNAEGRNLPSAIGFDIVEDAGNQYMVVTEAREFQSDGSPPAFAALQTGSVSSWKLQSDGNLTAVKLDAMQKSDDGRYLYQLYGLAGIVGVYASDADGFGSGLSLIQEVNDLPLVNTQGIVAI